MKATKIFMMAALALTFAACSNNDDNDFAQQPAAQPANGEITITATLEANDGASTRALSIDGINIASTWETTDQFAILYNNGTENTKSIATVDKIDGTTVTITFTIPASLASNTPCTIVYPASAAKADNTGADVATALATQDGTIGNCPEVRVGTATIDKDNHSLTSVTKLSAQNAIFKFTLSGTSIDNSHPLVIKDGSEKVITTVKPASSTNSVYVAMPAAASSTYKFIVTTGDNKYIKSGTAAITARKYYQTTLAMAPRYPLGISNVTIDDIGSVVSGEGTMYLNTTVASAAGKPAVAVIAYVGSDTGENSPYNHGLALALNDAGYCMWSESDTDANTTDQREPFSPEGGRQYIAGRNSDAYPAFKAAITYKASDDDINYWFLPSAYQWTQMINGAGGVDNLRNMANLPSADYWTSSEYKDDVAWLVDTDEGIINTEYKGQKRYVRACFAF